SRSPAEALLGSGVAISEMLGRGARRGGIPLDKLEHASQQLPGMKRLGDELVQFGIAPRRGRRKSRGEQAFEAGLQRSRLVHRGQAVKRPGQPDLDRKSVV